MGEFVSSMSMYNIDGAGEAVSIGEPVGVVVLLVVLVDSSP